MLMPSLSNIWPSGMDFCTQTAPYFPPSTKFPLKRSSDYKLEPLFLEQRLPTKGSRLTVKLSGMQKRLQRWFPNCGSGLTYQ